MIPGVPAGAAILVLAAVFAYLPSMCGEFVMDDNLFVTENNLIQNPDGLRKLWSTPEYAEFYPLSYSTFWIEWRLWELNTAGYHAVNLIMHIIGAMLIWVILRKLSIPGAFLAAMVFALHPVNVESVAWIAQRRNVAAMLFLLLSILWYLKAERSGTTGDSSRALSNSGPWEQESHSSFIIHHSSFYYWYWLSLAAFVLAMLSKGSAAVLPALLLGILWWQGSLTRRNLLRIAPFFLLAAALTGVNIWYQTHGEHIQIRNAGFAERLLGAGCVPWFYLYKALLPFDLSFIYPRWHIDISDFRWWLPLLASIIVTLVLWWFRKGWSRPILFAWGFFCVSLVPVMGFTDVGFMKYSLVADHYQHIAVIGIIALVAAGWSIWRQRAQLEIRKTIIAIAVGTIGALAFLTWRQNGLYRYSVGLYQATLQKNPDSWTVRYNLGNALGQKGRWNDAIEQYMHALRLKPDYAEARNNLGNAYAQTGRLNEAIENYEQALLLQPDYADAHLNLGVALNNAGRLPEAIEHYRQALRLNPDSSTAHNDLGSALDQSGRYEEAIEQYEQALRLNPLYTEVHDNMGRSLVKASRLQEAIDHYQQALRLKPDYTEAHNDLGAALDKAGRHQEAISHFQQALLLKPDFTNVYCNLAMAYARMRQPTEAIEAARQGLELARSQGQSAQAKQIEEWLNNYRANLLKDPNAHPPNESDLPKY